jgi:hypothetical protein
MLVNRSIDIGRMGRSTRDEKRAPWCGPDPTSEEKSALSSLEMSVAAECEWGGSSKKQGWKAKLMK